MHSRQRQCCRLRGLLHPSAHLLQALGRYVVILSAAGCPRCRQSLLLAAAAAGQGAARARRRRPSHPKQRAGNARTQAAKCAAGWMAAAAALQLVQTLVQVLQVCA